MSSADLATTVIACPVCGTRYQVPRSTLGARGREVQCAQCGKPWHAVADALPPPPPPAPPPPAPSKPAKPPAPAPGNDDDRLFAPGEEDALDAAFEMEAEVTAPTPALPAAGGRDPEHEKTLAEIRSAIAPKPKKVEKPDGNNMDPVLLRRIRQSFSDRQARITARLPLARLRRTSRISALVLLAAILGLGVTQRTALVDAMPGLAGLYAALGMPVNVVGLQFEEPKTLVSLRGNKKVMTISARIRSIAGQPVEVPAVQVSLLDAEGATIYEWTTSPQAREMAPGDIFDFTTEVSSPPEGAARIRLSFSNRAGGISAPAPEKAL